MLQIDTNDIQELEAELKTFARKAFPFATRNTVNSAAFAAQKAARADVRNELTLRNRWTEQSIQVAQTRSLVVSQQEARVGSTADYMEDQEFGATKSKGGKRGVPIATSWSAGQSENSQPRTRLPRPANKLASIQLARRKRRGSNRKQQNLISIKTAAQSGRKYVFLDLGRRQGIFKVTGGKRRPKIKMVHDLSRQSVVIPRNPWLAPVVAEVQRMVPAFYADSLRFQARRLGLFR